MTATAALAARPRLLQAADHERHTDWHRSLIESDEATKQAAQSELLKAVDAGTDATASYMLKKLGCGIVTAEGAVPRSPNVPFDTTGKMSQGTETQLAAALRPYISRSEAADAAVWALCHAVWIRRGCFGPNPAAVFCGGAANTIPADDRTRNFLRRTGGLRIVRGNVSVLVDCPVATAYWRRLIAETASAEAARAGGALDPDAAHNALRLGAAWPRFARMTLRQVTAVSAPRAAAALIAALDIWQKAGPPATGDQIEAAVRSVGRLSHTRCLALTGWDTLLSTAQEALQP